MLDSAPEAWRAIIFVTIAISTLSVLLVAFVVISRRTFITIRKEKLAALQASELRFRSLIEQSFDAILLCDATGRINYASQSTNHIVGHPPEFFTGKRVDDLFGERFTIRVQELMEEQIGQIHRTILTEASLRHQNGSVRWMECHVTSLLDVQGIDAIVINVHDITERKMAGEKLAKSEDDLRALSTHLQSIREEERTSISREIHDELGQLLTVLKMDLVLLERGLEVRLQDDLRSGLHANIEGMSGMIDDIIQAIRRISTELRPQILDELGLRDAMEWEMESFEARTRIQCTMDLTSEEISLDSSATTALFRVFQEALTNVARHSGATTLAVSLATLDGVLEMDVRDNGRGAEEDELHRKTSLGILGMNERMKSIGGKLEVRGMRGEGTTVNVKLLLPVTDKTRATGTKEANIVTMN